MSLLKIQFLMTRTQQNCLHKKGYSSSTALLSWITESHDTNHTLKCCKQKKKKKRINGFAEWKHCASFKKEGKVCLFTGIIVTKSSPQPLVWLQARIGFSFIFFNCWKRKKSNEESYFMICENYMKFKFWCY